MDIILLMDFSPIKPDFGLLLWTSVIFLLFWFLMSRFAFTPIKDALKKREGDIKDSLDEAKRARDEMANLKSENEALLVEAREERSKILRAAKEAKDSIINEAKTKAKADAKKIMDDAIREIDNQKHAAITDVKNQAGLMAIEIAEKIIKKELKGTGDHEAFVNNLVKDFNLS